MSFKSKVYLFAIIFLGFAGLAAELYSFRTSDPFRLAAYLTLAVLASSLKVTLPGVKGTMSVLFVFLFVGILDLTLPETLVMGTAAACVQSFWLAAKPRKIIHVSFNIASLVVAILSAHLTYNAPFLLAFGVPPAWRLILAATVFFVVNTLSVAVIIAFTEQRPLVQTWRSHYFWFFPYYIIGASLAGLFSAITRLVGWQISFLGLPLIYLIHRSYRLYLDRLQESQVHSEDLRAAANRLNSVLESTTDCVFAITEEGRITYVNQKARSRLFPDSDPVGTVLWDRFPKLTKDGLQEQVRTALAKKSALDTEEFFAELKAWFEVHAYPSTEGLAFYLKEVTEQRLLSEQLRQAQKMEAVGRLTGGVAHDFNNLLTIILGYGQVAFDKLGDNHSAQRSIQEVLKAGQRAAALTQRLLAFSRKQVLQPEVLDLNVVISGMEGMMRRMIGEDVRVSVSPNPRIGKVLADRSQIEQVIMNLVVNARDAMPNGGELRIATDCAVIEDSHASASGEYTVLSITDTGQGMDAATKARIFEPFFTTKEKGKGTGLGLSIVYNMVQQSGGFLTVQSEPGRGATFLIHLPCVKELQQPVAAAGTDVVRLQPRAGKILLVEDEDAVRELAHQMLVQAGYTVFASSDGVGALQMSRVELDSVDMLITDVVMPGMSGPELSERLIKRQPALKVLYLSGYTDDFRIQAALLSDWHGFLQKPFTQIQLLAKVEKVLNSERSSP